MYKIIVSDDRGYRGPTHFGKLDSQFWRAFKLKLHPYYNFSYLCRIDGLPLRYHYLPGIGSNHRGYCGDEQQPPDVRASFKGIQNDFGALCRDLLASHGVFKPLWAAVVIYIL